MAYLCEICELVLQAVFSQLESDTKNLATRKKKQGIVITFSTCGKKINQNIPNRTNNHEGSWLSQTTLAYAQDKKYPAHSIYSAVSKHNPPHSSFLRAARLDSDRYISSSLSQNRDPETAGTQAQARKADSAPERFSKKQDVV